MIPTSPALVWGSRLRTRDFEEQMGFALAADHEIPHVRGLPAGVSVPVGATVVREWPNVAGRLETSSPTDIVRWDRGLAFEPVVGVIVPRGDDVHDALLRRMTSWMKRFARSLTQIPGVSIATPSETPRALILTPHGVEERADLPDGMEPSPSSLAEFPGGVVLTMHERSFEHRAEYADTVATIIEEG